MELGTRQFRLARSFVWTARSLAIASIVAAILLFASPLLFPTFPWLAAIVSGSLAALVAFGLRNEAFWPDRYTIELSRDRVRVPAFDRSARWSELSDLRERRFLRRVDILHQAGARFASLEFQLESFDEALDLTLDGISPRPPPRDVFGRAIDWGAGACLLAATGLIALSLIAGSLDAASGGLLFLGCAVWQFTTSTRTVSLREEGIEVRTGLARSRIPWHAIADVRVAGSTPLDVIVELDAGLPVSIRPGGANPFHLSARIEEHLEAARAVADGEAPSSERATAEEAPPASPAALVQPLGGGAGRLPKLTLALLLFVPVAAIGRNGSVSTKLLGGLLLGFVGLRLLSLARESRTPRMTPEEQERLRSELETAYQRASADERAHEAWSLGREESHSPPELATLALDALRRSRASPRPGATLAWEAVGLIGLMILAPLGAVVLTSDFVPLNGSLGLTEVGVVGLSAGLYSLPFFFPASFETARRIWWLVPFVPALLLAHWGITVEHPYLDPSREDRAWLAAEQVLSLSDNVSAGGHADRVFDYARELDEQGDAKRAMHYYREGLRLAPQHPHARARLLALERESGGVVGSYPADARADSERAHAPLLAEGLAVAARPRCGLDRGLARIDRTIAVLVAMGEVDDGLLDAAGATIERELGLPSCVVERAIELPPYTRTHPLAGRQWSVTSLATALLKELQPPFATPALLVVVTPVDLYAGKSNYVFASSFAFGAIVSSARFGDPVDEKLVVARRTAKQALGSLLKSFGVPTSPDPNCVTSYPRNLAEFDAKGNRPNATTLALFHQALEARNRQWARRSGAAATTIAKP